MKRKKVASYTAKMITRIGFMMLVGIVAVFHVALFRTWTVDAIIPLVLTGMTLLFDAFLLWWGIIFVTQSRVTFFEEGIELERGGSKLFSPWENVSHFGIRGYGKTSKRGIYLHEKISPQNKGFVESKFFGDETNFIPIGQLVNLPRMHILSRDIDTDKLLKSDFGQDLYELAPHLFEDYEDMKPKNRLEDEYQDDSGLTWLEDLQSKEKKRG